ncbi:MAG: ABC transporter substrate-binding protein [Acidimicrobiales bacterium]
MLGSACLVLASCGGSAGSTPNRLVAIPKGSALVALKSGTGTVTVVVPAVPSNLNPHTLEGDAASTRMISALTDPQVFEVNPSVTPVLDTDFVVSAEVVSVKPQTVLYQLNPKAVWSDGVTIGAKDFVYNWEEQAGSGTAAPPIVGGYDAATTLGYRDIQSITATTSGDSVRVVFSTPYADWADLFDDLIPEHVGDVIGWASGYGTPSSLAYVSGGPYEIESWTPGSRIVLVRNPRWWGTPGRVETIVVNAATGSSTGTSLRSSDGGDQLSNGSAQVVYTNDFDAEMLDEVSSSPSEESNVSLGTTMLQLVFDLGSANDQSSDLRQAIALDLNRRQIVSELVQPLDPNVQVDDDFLATNAQHAYTRDGVLYDIPDPQEAAVLLQQAGLTMSASGTWLSGGAPVVLNLRWASGDPWSDLVAPAIQAALVQAGFGVKANPVASRQLGASTLADSNWDLALVPVVSSPYPTQMAADYSEAQAVTGEGASYDWSGFDAPEVDALFQEAAIQLNPTKAATYYQQIDQMLWQAMPSIPLFAEPSLLESDAAVSGVEAAVWGAGPLWKATRWALLGVAPKHHG